MDYVLVLRGKILCFKSIPKVTQSKLSEPGIFFLVALSTAH